MRPPLLRQNHLLPMQAAYGKSTIAGRLLQALASMTVIHRSLSVALYHYRYHAFNLDISWLVNSTTPDQIGIKMVAMHLVQFLQLCPVAVVKPVSGANRIKIEWMSTVSVPPSPIGQVKPLCRTKNCVLQAVFQSIAHLAYLGTPVISG